MVRLEGFEPPTIRVEAEYSNPLSYSRIYLFILNYLPYPLDHSHILFGAQGETRTLNPFGNGF